jgi:diaminopimelate decarboxylase
MGFDRPRGVLCCDGVPLDEIASATGTPVHVYSGGALSDRYRRLERAVASYPHRLHYAIKANATLPVVRLLKRLGAAADANSGGELEVARRAGFVPSEIVFTGVGKTTRELDDAIGLGVRAINAESPGEVARIAALAEQRGARARVALRITPDVDAGSHPHISTGLRATKFGVTPGEALVMVDDIMRRPSLHLVGLHVHVGSQITSLDPLARAATVVCDLARDLVRRGVALEHVDLGGGLGIPVRGEPVVAVEDYAKTLIDVVRPTGLTLLLEPGRWLVGPAGVIVTAVVDVKQRPDGGLFVIVDAGMTDLIRPALYDAWHDIEAVVSAPGSRVRADVVGPVCETSDTLGTDRDLPPVEVGDLLVIRDTGAYGAVMASNYNRRPMAAEVLVEDGRAAIARRRQTLADLLQWDE